VSTCVACLSLGLALAPLASCGGPTYVIQQYGGAPRPRESVAVIRLDGSDAVQILSIDREQLPPVERGVRILIELLPGKHEIAVAEPNGGLSAQLAVRFVAEAGRVYRVIVAPSMAAGATGAYVARVHEIDPSSGALIRVVNSSASTAARAERPRADGAAPVPSDGGSGAQAFDAAGEAAVRD
jgi:hypothetical protein